MRRADDDPRVAGRAEDRTRTDRLGHASPGHTHEVGARVVEGLRLQRRGGGRQVLGDLQVLPGHERHDGGGYPRGLVGPEISLAGRIVAITDAFDVMTAVRSYKAPLPAAQARAELLRNAGTQFDPICVEAFFERLDNITAFYNTFSDS